MRICTRYASLYTDLYSPLFDSEYGRFCLHDARYTAKFPWRKSDRFSWRNYDEIHGALQSTSIISTVENGYNVIDRRRYA